MGSSTLAFVPVPAVPDLDDGIVRVPEFDKLVPEPLVQPGHDHTDAFLQAVMVDEKREAVDRPVGGVLAGSDLDLLDGIRYADVLGGVAAELFEVECCALGHAGSLGGGEGGVNEAIVAIVNLASIS